jgi:hypothetical protein
MRITRRFHTHCHLNWFNAPPSQARYGYKSDISIHLYLINTDNGTTLKFRINRRIQPPGRYTQWKNRVIPPPPQIKKRRETLRVWLAHRRWWKHRRARREAFWWEELPMITPSSRYRGHHRDVDWRVGDGLGGEGGRFGGIRTAATAAAGGGELICN